MTDETTFENLRKEVCVDIHYFGFGELCKDTHCDKCSFLINNKQLIEKYYYDKQKVQDALKQFWRYELTENNEELRKIMAIDYDKFIKILKELGLNEK